MRTGECARLVRVLSEVINSELDNRDSEMSKTLKAGLEEGHRVIHHYLGGAVWDGKSEHRDNASRKVLRSAIRRAANACAPSHMGSITLADRHRYVCDVYSRYDELVPGRYEFSLFMDFTPQ